MAEVISVGPGGMVDGKDVAMTVKPGDKVITSQYAGTKVKPWRTWSTSSSVRATSLPSLSKMRKEGAGSPFGFPTASLRTGDAAQGGWVKVFLPRTCRGKNNLNYFRVPRNF